MATSEKPTPPLALCENLRAHADHAPDVASRANPYTPFYCGLTLQAYGPDDGSVCPEDCSPERSCFVRSLRSPDA